MATGPAETRTPTSGHKPIDAEGSPAPSKTEDQRQAETTHFEPVPPNSNSPWSDVRQMSDVVPASDVALASDVQLASESFADLTGGAWPTGQAPSCPLAAAAEPKKKSFDPTPLNPGDVIDDFEILSVLGAGAFGVVYLARQMSLDRRVALKVAANQGSEGRTMARLEHRHIVQVYSECVDPSGTQRLLCMQLVPGASLQAVSEDLSLLREVKGYWNGADYLAAIDARARLDDTLDSMALRDRDRLAQSDDIETAAWVGARLADALDFAHRHGVLHRDIKPANILVDRYGRPYLADFNIAYRGFDESASAEDTFGGTLAYMAPEHLEAFHPQHAARAGDIDGRADLYSLALVIYELLNGRSPFKFPKRGAERLEYISQLADIRRTSPPPLTVGESGPRKSLEQVLARALAPEPAERYATGEQLAAALDGCCELRQAERRLPKPGWLTKRALLRPILWVILLALAPQFIGSAVNISYNTIEIVTKLLSPAQLKVFPRVVLVYNSIVYPFAAVAGYFILAPILRDWRRLSGGERLSINEAAAARRRALRVPVWLLLLAAVGWLPGGIFFPAALHYWAGPLTDSSVFYHFLASFTLSGLIAAAYSFLGLEALTLRVLYPKLWADPTGFQQIAHEELCCTRLRLRIIQWLAGSIPLLSALLILMFWIVLPQQETEGFKLLLGALILLGWIGFEVTRSATQQLTRTWVALSGAE